MLSLFTASSFPPGGWEPAGTAGRGSELNPIRACGTLSARLSSCGIHLPLRVFDFLSSGGHLSSGRDSCSSGRLKPVNDPFVSPPGLDFCRMICTFLRRGTPRCPKAGVCPKYCCPICCRALILDARTPPLRSSDLLAAARHATPILQLQNPLVHADHDVLRVGRSVGRICAGGCRSICAGGCCSQAGSGLPFHPNAFDLNGKFPPEQNCSFNGLMMGLMECCK